MKSFPAPHVLRVVKRHPEPGSLARRYIMRSNKLEEERNSEAINLWLEKIKKDKGLKRGSHLGIAWPNGDECPLYREFLSPKDRARIRDRAETIEKKRPASTLLAARLPAGEKEQLYEASRHRPAGARRSVVDWHRKD